MTSQVYEEKEVQVDDDETVSKALQSIKRVKEEIFLCLWRKSKVVYTLHKVGGLVDQWQWLWSMSLSHKLFKIYGRYDTGDKNMIAVIDNLSGIIYLKT